MSVSLPAASTMKPEERELVVGSGASMHMVSKEDLHEAELETVRVSKSPAVVMTANGEVQAKEEATVYVRQLDVLVTVMLLEKYTDSSLTWQNSGKNLGPVTIWTSGDKPHLIKARNFVATHQIMYHSSYLVYPRVPQETVTDTQVPATRSESAGLCSCPCAQLHLGKGISSSFHGS